MEEPDPQTIAAARSGDMGAFAELVRRYQADVWRMCLHVLQDPNLADDVTQDAFVRAFRFLRRFRGDSKFSTWLFSIARNCAMDEIRKAGRRRRITQRVEAERPPSSPELGLALEIREAIASLPLELREPVVLIDVFGISYREASRLLKVPEGTVKSRVHRARDGLATMLAPVAKEAGNEI